jgi:TRAP-type C4-dicarboxylate transport system substrate-binding protein
MGDPTMFVANPKVWESFSPEDQALITQAALDAAKYQKALSRVGIDENDGGSNAEYLKSLGQAPEITDWDAELARVGMTVTNLTPDEIKLFVDKTKPVIEAWRAKIGEDLIKAAEEDMASVR